MGPLNIYTCKFQAATGRIFLLRVRFNQPLKFNPLAFHEYFISCQSDFVFEQVGNNATNSKENSDTEESDLQSLDLFYQPNRHGLAHDMAEKRQKATRATREPIH